MHPEYHIFYITPKPKSKGEFSIMISVSTVNCGKHQPYALSSGTDPPQRYIAQRAKLNFGNTAEIQQVRTKDLTFHDLKRNI